MKQRKAEKIEAQNRDKRRKAVVKCKASFIGSLRETYYFKSTTSLYYQYAQ